MEKRLRYLTAIESAQRDIEEIPLNEAVKMFLDARSLALSSSTIRGYRLELGRLMECLPADTPVCRIGPRQILTFLSAYPGCKKTKKNCYLGLSAFWSWCLQEGYAKEHVVHRLDPPVPDKRVVIPLERYEVSLLLEAARHGTAPERDKAILMVLLETGIRASELCGMKVKDWRMEWLRVFGKGSKERMVHLTASTMEAVGVYLATRKTDEEDPLFAAKGGEPISRFGLDQLIERLAKRGKVSNVFPHKFRHTFAIEYLLNGGDAYTLQDMLGHSTMDMVKRYLGEARRIKAVRVRHEAASPVRNWGF